MAETYDAQKTTRSSPLKGTSKPGSWQSERVFTASKTCLHCGTTFRPWIKRNQDGTIKSIMKENTWIKQEFCSISCSKKHRNPMESEAARKAMKKTLQKKGHQPIRRGGNGQLLPVPQLVLLHALGDGWEAELSIATGAGHLNGVYPNAYKVDIGNRNRKIAIELDGDSHGSIERKNKDKKKDEKLAELGWSVFRVSNKKAMDLYTTFTSVDTLLSSLMES